MGKKLSIKLYIIINNLRYKVVKFKYRIDRSITQTQHWHVFFEEKWNKIQNDLMNQLK